MRLNRYLAYRYGSSRRDADEAIAAGQILVNSKTGQLGQVINAETDLISWAGRVPIKQSQHITVLLNKPVGYVSSRSGQGSHTVYDLLPAAYQNLKIGGRLDKDSSGLVLLTTDGELIQQITHPSEGKTKQYLVGLDKKLSPAHIKELLLGIDIGDERPSRLSCTPTPTENQYNVSLGEGRNRQIRRTFARLGYTVNLLHRTSIGDIEIGDLESGHYKALV